ncbi:hypothetical protein MRX96_044589 [Rhipicephalus microplus]
MAQYLYFYVFCQADAPNSFEIITNFPRRTLPCEPTRECPEPPSFAEIGLGKTETVFVRDLDAFEKSSRQNSRQQHQGSQRVDLLNDRMWQWPDEQPDPMDVEKEIARVLSLGPMKSALLDQIPEEPDSWDPWGINLSIQLPEPSGRVLQRRFLLSHSLKYLHYYVLIQQDAPTNFDIFIKDTEQRVPCQPTHEDPDPPTFARQICFKVLMASRGALATEDKPTSRPTEDKTAPSRRKRSRSRSSHSRKRSRFEKSSRQNSRQQHQGSQRVDLLNDRMWQWPDEQPDPMDVEKEIARVLAQKGQDCTIPPEAKPQSQQSFEKTQSSLVPMKSALLDQIPEEPHIFDPWSIILSIQLPEPSGRLLQRGFLLSHSLKYLHYYVLIQQDAPTNFDIFIKDTEKRVPCQPTREDPDPPTFGGIRPVERS